MSNQIVQRKKIMDQHYSSTISVNINTPPKEIKLHRKLKIKANVETMPIKGTPTKFKIKKGIKLKMKTLKVEEMKTLNVKE